MYRSQPFIKLIYPLFPHFAQVPDGFVTDEFNGFPQGVLEVIGDGEGVLVAAFVQVVEQAHALGGKQTVAVQESGGGLQRGGFAPAQDVVKYEAQQAVVSPLAAFDQQDLAGRQQEHPTRRAPLAEYAPGDDVLPGFLKERFGRRRFTVELRWMRLQRERVFIFPVRIVGAENEQLRCAMLEAGDV